VSLSFEEEYFSEKGPAAWSPCVGVETVEGKGEIKGAFVSPGTRAAKCGRGKHGGSEGEAPGITPRNRVRLVWAIGRDHQNSTACDRKNEFLVPDSADE